MNKLKKLQKQEKALRWTYRIIQGRYDDTLTCVSAPNLYLDIRGRVMDFTARKWYKVHKKLSAYCGKRRGQ